MKRKVQIGVFCLTVITFFIYMKANRSGKVGDLLLDNVEALAGGESDFNGDCLGIGSVDCPISNTKVEYLLEGMSLRY